MVRLDQFRDNWVSFSYSGDLKTKVLEVVNDKVTLAGKWKQASLGLDRLFYLIRTIDPTKDILMGKKGILYTAAVIY